MSSGLVIPVPAGYRECRNCGAGAYWNARCTFCEGPPVSGARGSMSHVARLKSAYREEPKVVDVVAFFKGSRAEEDVFGDENDHQEDLLQDMDPRERKDRHL